MADFRLGRLKFKWRGNWATGTAYVIDDIVKYGANAYVCTTNHTSAANENLFYSSDLAKWAVHTEGVVSKGDWVASTWYKVNDVVKYGNNQYRATTGFTSGATFDATNLVTYLEGLKFESTWSPGGTYQIGDIVTYGGYAYVAKTNHTGVNTLPNSDASNWGIITTGFEAKGVYNGSTAYAPGDVVRYGGNSYVNIQTVTGTAPTDASYWTLLAEGFNWLGAWAAGTGYKLGDVVNRTSNSYVCIQANTGNDPSTDTNGTWWNYVAQGGAAAQVLTTAGDLIYQSAGTVARLALPAGSTGTAAEQAEASGQVLAVGGSPLLPRWESNNTTTSVYYVAETGSDTNSGKQISRAFLTIRHACETISALTGAYAPSATNPVSIYVKAGVYEEILPIHVPAHCVILGDNIRNTIVKANPSVNSNQQTLTLSSATTSYKKGEIVENDAGTKTAKVLDVNTAKTVFTVLNVTGGLWTTSDKYVDVVSNKDADGSTILTNNNEFIAWEAYHRHVANVGAVSGNESSVKARLQAFLTAAAYNVRAGDNNKVWDYANAVIGGGAGDITGNDTQDNALLNYCKVVGIECLQNVNVSKSAGNTKNQTLYSGTADTANPKCPTQSSTLTTLTAIVTVAVTNNNMSHATKTEPYHVISAATNESNAHSTMFYLGDRTIIRDLVMEGMSGFAANGGDDKDIDASTIKGVYLKLDPASPVTKSPYIQNCSAIGGAAVGAFVDGSAHEHFDASPTPSFKSMCFDAYTQVLEGGVGFYIKGTSAAEIVSSFTYYAHISYASTGGARIRAVSGNSSYGKYGCIARGFDPDEATINGTVAGLMLTTNPQGATSGTFQVNERISGGTSGAIGQLRSDQSVTSSKIYYIPIKGTFVQNELITGATSSATATIVNNTDAVRGQLGFIFVAEGLTTGPDQGGSVEMVDNGSNNDAGSYVISSSSYTAPDGRGSLTVARGQLGSTAATHDGTSSINLFPSAGGDTTITTALNNSVTDIDVASLTGMAVNGFVVVGNELMKITAFVDADTITVARAQEGTTAAAHSNAAVVSVLGAKVAGQDEIIKDVTTGTTDIRTAQAGLVFKNLDYIKVDSEFMKLSAAAADTTGITILNFADEKTIGCGDGQSFKTRYRYSQVRLTAHDFLDVGTGNRANTNWPGISLSPNLPSQEVDENRPGRVYYVSTDQDGNFAVGKFFKVEQATGKATLDASAFDLSGLSSLRLGSIGAQLGASINEFSIDGTLSQNSDVKCPTQKAVKTYVDGLSAVGGNFTIAGNLTVSGTTTTINTATLDVEDKNIIVGKVATPTDTTADGGGLTLKGASDKNFYWADSTDSWTSNQDLDLTNGKHFSINGTTVLDASTVLGKSIGGTSAGDIVDLASAQTLQNKTADALTLTGTLSAGGNVGTSGKFLESTGSGLQWSTVAVDATAITNGTTNVTAAASGSVTVTCGGTPAGTFDTGGNFTVPGTLTCGSLASSGLARFQLKEGVSDTGSGISGTQGFNVKDYQVMLWRGNSGGNWTINFRGDGSTSLSSLLSDGESVTCTVFSQNGGSTHYNNGWQIDGSGITPLWVGGFGTPTNGVANVMEVYTYTIIKVGGGGWRMYASQNYYS